MLILCRLFFVNSDTSQTLQNNSVIKINYPVDKCERIVIKIHKIKAKTHDIGLCTTLLSVFVTQRLAVMARTHECCPPMVSCFASHCRRTCHGQYLPHSPSSPPPQDHLLLPASPLLLQHLAAGLCPPSEAAGAAAPDHLGHPPAGDLPEAAVGEPAAARAPGQPVSKHTHTHAAASQRTPPSVSSSCRANIVLDGDWLVWLLPSPQQTWPQ